MATPLDRLPSESPLERLKATRGNPAQRQQFLADLARTDPWGSDYLLRYIQTADDVRAQGVFEQSGLAIPGHSPAALGPMSPGPDDDPSRTDAAEHRVMQMQDHQMNTMGYSAWRQAREAADGADNWVHPDGVDAGQDAASAQEGRGELQPSLVARAAQNLSYGNSTR